MSWLKINQFLSKVLDLFDEGFANIFGAIRNWGKWSDIFAVTLPDITSCDVRLHNIMSIRILEWPVSGVGWSISAGRELNASESRKLFVVLCLL